MQIRRTAVGDAERLTVLERALAHAKIGMVISPDQVRTIDRERALIRETLDEDGSTLGIVAELGDRIVGTALLKQLGPSRCRHVAVLSVGVHPDFQRRGIGRALMEHLIAHARASGLVRLELYVRSDNDRAQTLYRSLGFAHEGTRARFVRLDDGTARLPEYADDFIFSMFL